MRLFDHNACSEEEIPRPHGRPRNRRCVAEPGITVLQTRLSYSTRSGRHKPAIPGRGHPRLRDADIREMATGATACTATLAYHRLRSREA